jgi:hypothetical protein
MLTYNNYQKMAAVESELASGLASELVSVVVEVELHTKPDTLVNQHRFLNLNLQMYRYPLHNPNPD